MSANRDTRTERRDGMNITEHTELKGLILEGYQPSPSGSDWRLNPGVAADGILKAGYRKLRTITTVEELDALPNETIVKDREGPLEKLEGRWFLGDYENEPRLPVTLLWEGGADE